MKNKTKKLLFVFSLLMVVMLCIGFNNKSYASTITVNFDTSTVPSLKIASEEVEVNGLITPPGVWLPQYDCVGWYKEPEFVNLWEFETDKVQDNITLYGKFVAKEAYDVYVGGHRFTKDHLTVNLDEGTATFNPESSLLTLNNVFNAL